MNHRAAMERVKAYPRYLRYSTKNYSAKFACLVCGREVWQSLNYLGSRVLVCNSGKAEKINKAEWETEKEMTAESVV